ncbi:MAG: GerAB/ArcD/ProY family transporter [Bacillota bacterium]
MIEKGKISCIQTVLLVMNMIGATAVMFLPDIVARQAGRDSWLSFALPVLPGFYILAILYFLQKRFSSGNLIHFLQESFGNILGKVIALLYLLFFVHTSTIIVHEFSELISATILQNTPLVIMQTIIILLCAYAIIGGLEVVARSFEFASAIIAIFLIVALFLAFGVMQIENLFPVLENGILPVIRGSIPPVAWVGEIILSAMLLPYLKKPEEGIRCFAIAIIILEVILIANAILITAILGTAADRITFPTFEMIRVLGGTEFRFDALIIIIWFMGLFGKIALFYYVTVLATAQVLNLKSYRNLVLPMGIIIMALTSQLMTSTVELSRYREKYWPLFAYTFEYIVPSIMICVLWLRGILHKAMPSLKSR